MRQRNGSTRSKRHSRHTVFTKGELQQWMTEAGLKFGFDSRALPDQQGELAVIMSGPRQSVPWEGMRRETKLMLFSVRGGTDEHELWLESSRGDARKMRRRPTSRTRRAIIEAAARYFDTDLVESGQQLAAAG